MDKCSVMKLAEIITILSVIFLVTFTTGDGAPQWRPQGRFGKRLDQRFANSWESDIPDKDIDVFPVIEENTDLSDEKPATVNLINKLCVESNIAGLYRCYR
ncbi:hypothetical protein KUTeg_015307 [Tegillarca granosa]|uniref:Uncharacterized protein n=1 Tax=Tegillarca granosa TaxID=220873 RepID=A0ABQ9EPS0_TEGGR|nr:hypothetical protein KUTeg_015307 [Tegillarca granosa]